MPRTARWWRARKARAACWISSLEPAPGSSISRIFTSRCANRPRSGAACATSMRAASTSGKFVVITSPVRFIPEEVERSMMFLELRPPDLIELVDFLRDETTRRRAKRSCTRWRARLQGLTLDEARYALRRALAASPAAGAGVACPRCSKRNGCWSIAAACIEYISDAHGPRRGRRPGGSEELAAGAPQAFSDARQPERRDRAQGPAHHGHSRLRQEPLRQGHRFALSASRCIAWT